MPILDKLIFLDTETTSADDGARLVQLALRIPDDDIGVSAYFKPPCSILFEAMAVHHITDDMVANAPSFHDSIERQKLRQWIDRDFTVVAHNAKFDVAVLEREGVAVPRYICTLKVALDVFPDYPQHKLQYLRYREELKVETSGDAHDAQADTEVLQALYEHLALKVCDKYAIPHEQAQSKMLDITNNPTLLHKMKFGKYYGKTFEEIAKSDSGYFEWIVSTPDIDEDVRYTARHWLNKATDST